MNDAKPLDSVGPIAIEFDEKDKDGMMEEEYGRFCQSWIDVYRDYEKDINNAVKYRSHPLSWLKYFVQKRT